MTYQVTLTLSADIVNNHQELVNSVTATGTIVTRAGVSLQATSTSDDPLTAQQDDPTIISLVVTPSVEITKTATETDADSSGDRNQGDLITYTITVSNTGDTPNNIIRCSLRIRLARSIFLLPYSCILITWICI